MEHFMAVLSSIRLSSNTFMWMYRRRTRAAAATLNRQIESHSRGSGWHGSLWCNSMMLRAYIEKRVAERNRRIPYRHTL
jgi:hypothetical protein